MLTIFHLITTKINYTLIATQLIQWTTAVYVRVIVGEKRAFLLQEEWHSVFPTNIYGGLSIDEKYICIIYISVAPEHARA